MAIRHSKYIDRNIETSNKKTTKAWRAFFEISEPQVGPTT